MSTLEWFKYCWVLWCQILNFSTFSRDGTFEVRRNKKTKKNLIFGWTCVRVYNICLVIIWVLLYQILNFLFIILKEGSRRRKYKNYFEKFAARMNQWRLSYVPCFQARFLSFTSANPKCINVNDKFRKNIENRIWGVQGQHRYLTQVWIKFSYKWNQ